MERTQLYLPKTYKEALRREAARRRVTFSEIVRTLVRERLEVRNAGGKKRRQETLLEAAKRINALGQKGPRDLASRLDEYLYGNV